MPNATYSIKRYTPALRNTWDAFIRVSRNGTFLLERGFMDYHADRFTDHSMLFYRDEKLIALLPAEEREGTLTSHGGLTYGGLIFGAEGTAVSTLKCMETLVNYLRTETQIRSLRYSPPPAFYANYPSQEDRYALFRIGGTLTALKLTSVIPLGSPLPMNQLRKRKVKACEKAGLQLMSDTDFAAFWNILEENLKTRHDVRPVHTLQEMQLLHSRFPDNIHLHRMVDSAGQTHGGCVVFETQTTAHIQYIASTPYGRAHGALDGLFNRLIHQRYTHKQWLDFGVSVEQGGAILNEGLVMQKEGFGARAFNYETWEVRIK